MDDAKKSNDDPEFRSRRYPRVSVGQRGGVMEFSTIEVERVFKPKKKWSGVEKATKKRKEKKTH